MWLLKDKYGGEKTPAFEADLERLRNGEPLAYLSGHVPFLHTTIYLDSRPLIPRPETEFWLSHVIESMKNRGVPLRILDLCAGSGCIGVAVKKEIRTAEVDFAELDHKHHQTIQKNLDLNDVAIPTSHIFGGDLFTHVEGTYDYILTNPPYIDPSADRTEKSVRDYEPSLALYGGEHGLFIIMRIIEVAAQYLTETGIVVIEHEPEQEIHIKNEAMLHGFEASTHPDQYGTIRYTVLTRPR
jgi:release factor glutamine methyltransferase